MPYADNSDLLQRVDTRTLAQLTDDASGTVIDQGVVDGRLQTASGMVDSYTRARYQTPLQQSDTITAITADIAVYLLFQRRPGQMRENVKQAYDDAVAVLRDISTGKAALDQPDGVAAQQTPNATPALPSTQTLRFTDCNMQGFI